MKLAPLAPIAIAVALFALLTALQPRYFQHIDEIQLALGARDFDLVWHHPHPPGYYGFVVLARAAGLVAPVDAAGRAIASLAAALFVVAVGLRAAPAQRAALAAAAAVFVVCSPLVLSFSLTGLTHLPEAVAYLALLLALAARPRGAALVALGLGIGLAASLRPTLLVWGVAMVGVQTALDRRWREALRAQGWGRSALALGAPLALGVALWLVPMLVESGGWQAWRRATAQLALSHVLGRSILARPPHELLAERLPAMTGDLALGLGLLVLPVALGLWLRWRRPDDALRALDPLLPGAALAFVFYLALIYDSRGYAVAPVLVLAAWGLLAFGALAARWPASLRGLAFASLFGGLALATLGPGGLARPGGGALGAARAHDADLAARFAAIRELPAERTVLLTSHEYWAGSFRHVMYYLPEYTTLQLARDPHYLGATDEMPYLTAARHEVWTSGPDGLRLDMLGGHGPAPEQLVYVFPRDAAEFVDASCRPRFRALRAPGLRAEARPLAARIGPDVRILAQRLVCGSDAGR